MTPTERPEMPTTSIVIDADVRDMRDLFLLVKRTAGTPGLLGYLVHAGIVMAHGIGDVEGVIRGAAAASSPPAIVYNHGSGATGNPDDAPAFADALDLADVDYATICPMAGKPVLDAYVEALAARGRKAICQCVMTYKPDGWIQHDGGWMVDGSPHAIFDHAFGAGVRDFMVPTDSPDIAADLMRHVVAGYADLERAELTLWVPGRMRAAGDWWGAGAVVYVNGEIAKSRDAGEAARDFARVVSKKD